jgi:hypothetical protein
MDGLYVSNTKRDGGKCYTYQVLKRICLLIAFRENPKTSSFYWEYRGGCYTNGEIGVYEKATPGNEYRFDSIPIEVRDDDSLFTRSDKVRGIASSVFYFASSACLFVALILALTFAGLFYTSWKANQEGSGFTHQR